MQNQGVVPDLITYNAMIYACVASKRPERALELIKAMQHQDVALDVVAQLMASEKGGMAKVL